MTLSNKKNGLTKTVLTAIALSVLGACSSVSQAGYNTAPQAYGHSAQSAPVVKQTDFWSIITGKTRAQPVQQTRQHYAAQTAHHGAGYVWSDIYSGQLRPAPAPHYNFAAVNPAQPAFMNHSRRLETVKARPRFQHFLDGGSGPMSFAVPAPQPTYIPPHENEVSQHSLPAPAPAPTIKTKAMTTDTPVAQNQLPPHTTAQARPEPAEHAQSQSLSYVKMGGGSQISDWQACEAQAGGYFIPTPSGFSVEPGFDSCMRAKGYKPEAEAQAELELQGGASTL